VSNLLAHGGTGNLIDCYSFPPTQLTQFAVRRRGKAEIEVTHHEFGTGGSPCEASEAVG